MPRTSIATASARLPAPILHRIRPTWVFTVGRQRDPGVDEVAGQRARDIGEALELVGEVLRTAA